MMNKSILSMTFLVVFLAGFMIGNLSVWAGEGGGMRLTSTAFSEGGDIPQKYTCDGQDISPPLNWESLPKGTKSLALICDDPDAPSQTWVHWVYFDIPADKKGLPENCPSGKKPATGGTQGTNDNSNTGYNGPCPPDGTHRYFFKLYALDVVLNLKPGFFGINKAKLLKQIEGHIIGEAKLMGKYSR